MAMFKAFKPEAMNKIAGAMGYTGNMDSFQQYIEQDPARKARMDGFVKAAQTMAKGGMVRKMATGGFTATGFGEPNFYQPQQGETLTRKPVGNTGMRAYAAVMPVTGGEYAFKPDGDRVTVKQGYFDPQPSPKQVSDMDGPGFEQTSSPLGPLQGVVGNQNPVYRGVGATSQTPPPVQPPPAPETPS